MVLWWLTVMVLFKGAKKCSIIDNEKYSMKGSTSCTISQTLKYNVKRLLFLCNKIVTNYSQCMTTSPWPYACKLGPTVFACQNCRQLYQQHTQHSWKLCCAPMNAPKKHSFFSHFLDYGCDILSSYDFFTFVSENYSSITMLILCDCHWLFF